MAVKEWFPHDYHATRDVKIMRMIREGGAACYGMYWHVVEMLHYTPDATTADVADSLQVVMRVSQQDAQQALQMFVQHGLFEVTDNDQVKSERIERNIMARNEVSNRGKHAAAKRWDATAMPKQCHGNAEAMLLHNITEHNSTEEKNSSSVRKRTTNARPVDDAECIAYFAELNMPAAEAQRFTDYYTANGWRVGRNPMKDWKAAARNWRKGFNDRVAQQQPTQARTAPQGLPKQVVEIANRPKLSQTDVEAFKAAYLSKVTPDE
jgi:uncharacterized protein YdaU (DUF1376 family)